MLVNEVSSWPCPHTTLFTPKHRVVVTHQLAAKQMLGGPRQCVFAPESCERSPELDLLARSVVTYLAATSPTLPAVPTGFWDRGPKPASGSLRCLPARTKVHPLPKRL
jgi:hypothetical protein